MAKCEICSKDMLFGLAVSHSNRKTNRAWKPNVRKVKVIENGTAKSVNICTRCLRSKKVTRAV
ncbi:MAG: 50S ribosomal protein L28 [Clostridia bacterium]|nr:50S ribosomal protein L28 [Clostridia bacterium]